MSHDPRDAEAARRRVLDPYHNRLREWNHRIPGMNGNRPAIVQVGKRQLRVESRERAVIEHWAPEREAPNADSRLVMDSLALMIKLLNELEQAANQPSSRSQAGAEIMISIALGQAVQKQLMALAGKHGETLWAGLSSRMEQTIRQARDFLGEVDESKIASLSAAFEVHRPPKKVTAPKPVGEAPPPIGAPTLADQLQPEHAELASILEREDEDGEDLELPAELQATVDPPSTLSSRTRGAMLLCLSSLLIWTLAMVVPRLFHEPESELDLSSLEQLNWVDLVVSRPASLYVDVDSAKWEAMPHAERWVAMKQLVEECAGTGARGILVRDASDRPLAQWIEGRGVVLHTGPESDGRQVTESKGGARKRSTPTADNPENTDIPAREPTPWD